MEEMRAAQKEILDRRRDPSKMNVYHQQEKKRHEQFDHKHDIDIEQEVAKEWIAGEKPLPKPAPTAAHSVLDDLKNFMSRPKKEPERETVEPNLPVKLASSLNKSMKTILADFVPKKPIVEKEPELKTVVSNLPMKQETSVNKSMNNMSSSTAASSSALSTSFSGKTATNPIGGYLENMSSATAASSSAPSASFPVTAATNPMGGYLDNMTSTTPASNGAPSASTPATTATNPMGGYLDTMSGATPASSSAPFASFPATTATNTMGGYLDSMSGAAPASSSPTSASFAVTTATNPMGGYHDNMSTETPALSNSSSASSLETTATVIRRSVSTISATSIGGVESKGSANSKPKYEDDAVADVILERPVIEKEPEIETVDISIPYDVIQDLYQYLDDVQVDKDHPSVWMPRPLELLNMGRDDLVQALERYGGFDKICKLAGLVPFREWSNFEGQYELLLELRNYLNLYHGGDHTYFPPESDIKRHGYDQLYSLVQFYGGSELLANRFSMSSKNSPRLDCDFSIDAAIELYCFVRADQMKKKGPLRRPVIVIPSQKDLLANGQGQLHQSIVEMGGYESVARRLGLDFSG